MLILEKLTGEICAAAIEVHKHVGPGLLESAYEECLCHELSLRRLGSVRVHPACPPSPVAHLFETAAKRV